MPSLRHIFSSQYFLLAFVPEGFSHLHSLLLKGGWGWGGGHIIENHFSRLCLFPASPSPGDTPLLQKENGVRIAAELGPQLKGWAFRPPGPPQG